jgi:hypothetical protein
MATIVFFHSYAGDLLTKVHDFNADQFAVYLTNTTPDVATDAVKADLAEIATGGGYTGPIPVTMTFGATGGVATATVTDETVTATTGGIAEFRYAVLMNDDTTGDRLIGYWDRGSGLTLADTESVDLDFSGAVVTVDVT